MIPDFPAMSRGNPVRFRVFCYMDFAIGSLYKNFSPNSFFTSRILDIAYPIGTARIAAPFPKLLCTRMVSAAAHSENICPKPASLYLR